MNKKELATAIAKETGLSERVATAVLKASLEVIIRTLSEGGTVAINGFGVFASKRREARTGRNPITGESIKIKPTNTVRFTPGSPFKDAVNNRK